MHAGAERHAGHVAAGAARSSSPRRRSGHDAASRPRPAPELQALAKSAVAAHLSAGRNDEAIAAVHRDRRQGADVRRLLLQPGRRPRQEEAVRRSGERRSRRSVELKPTTPTRTPSSPTSTTRRRSSTWRQRRAPRRRRLRPAPRRGGGNAEALYNQGVILWNGGKFAEAKTQFEARDKADPNMAHGALPARDGEPEPRRFRRLARQFAGAYLRLDPNGAEGGRSEELPLPTQLKREWSRSKSSRCPVLPQSGCSEVRARIDAAARWPAGTPPPSGSSPSPRHSPSTQSARRTPPASATSAKTAFRKALREDRRIDRPRDQRWHLLGHLQTNKARKAGPAFAMIQSVDSVELLAEARCRGRRIGTRAGAADSGGPRRAKPRSTARRPGRCRDSSTPRLAAAPPGSSG